MSGFISGERGRCGVLWTSGTMNSGHVTKRVSVHVCKSGSSKCDFVLLKLLTLMASKKTTFTFSLCTNVTQSFPELYSKHFIHIDELYSNT